MLYQVMNVTVTVSFDVDFYLVAILFLVFEIEVAYLIPWALGVVLAGWAGLAALLLFLAVLVIGFIYEWGKGALDWNSRVVHGMCAHLPLFVPNAYPNKGSKA